MYTIVGIRHTNFTTQDGKQISGRTVFLTFPDNHTDGVATDKIFLSQNKFGDTQLLVGMSVDLFYNKYGKVDYIRTYEEK